uniref:Uncharacterized protein n=1 Tax=Cacopsylla melanoneura TaxID=428564 RepID=A0A8D8TRD6_9HEMI
MRCFRLCFRPFVILISKYLHFMILNLEPCFSLVVVCSSVDLYNHHNISPSLFSLKIKNFINEIFNINLKMNTHQRPSFGPVQRVPVVPLRQLGRMFILIKVVSFGGRGHFQQKRVFLLQ